MGVAVLVASERCVDQSGNDSTVPMGAIDAGASDGENAANAGDEYANGIMIVVVMTH